MKAFAINITPSALILLVGLFAPVARAAEPPPAGPLATINVMVSLEIQTGTVAVNVTPDTASWSFTDGIGGVHNGTGNDTITSVPVGLISFAWNHLDNYDPPPAPPAQALEKDGTVEFSGVYTRHTGTVIVEVTPDTAPWSFTDGDGEQHTGTGSQEVSGVPTGEISLTWEALHRYSRPSPPEPKWLAKDQAVAFSGVYTRRTGIVAITVSPAAGLWSFTDGAGETHSGEGNAVVSNVPTGDINLTWQPLVGYYNPSPNPETQTLVWNEQVTFEGLYAEAPDVRILGTVLDSVGDPVAGAQILTENGGFSTETDSSGAYALSVPYHWSGRVRAREPGYWFAPPSREYSLLTEERSGQDYEAILKTTQAQCWHLYE